MNAPKIIETNITKSYRKLYALYLTSSPIEEQMLTPGIIQVRVKDNVDLLVEGTLNSRGGLTGMAKLYAVLGLKEGDKVAYSIVSKTELLVHSPLPKDFSPDKSLPETVGTRQKLKWIHVEPFRPENLKNWEPKYETDVYLAFGVLQRFTAYQYCCGTSKEFLEKLGYTGDITKPDAILLNTVTQAYAIAEFKMRSSGFINNHHKDEVDVLVVWDDDQIDNSVLPPVVIDLREVARIAALEDFED